MRRYVHVKSVFITMMIDAYGIIAQQDMTHDGGDSLHREGMYAFGMKMRYDYLNNKLYVPGTPTNRPPTDQILSKFEVQPGIYIRHPDPTKWYSNPETTSRDQVFPLIAYCAAAKDYDRLWRLFVATAKRGFFAQNIYRNWDDGLAKGVKIPDPMFLNIPDFIRAGGRYTVPLYPLLYIFDTIDLAGTIFDTIPLHWSDDHLLPRWRKLGDVDQNNMIIKHLLAAEFKPTPISWLSRYIYSVSRPTNLGVSVMKEENPVMGALVWYHRADAGIDGNPEMAEVYRPLVEKYFTFLSPIQMVEKLQRLTGPVRSTLAMDTKDSAKTRSPTSAK
jgi:hypothetical protein